jgi:hypothetical protein
MANVIEAVQKKLGYPPLQKIDPNIHDLKDSTQTSGAKLAQAAIPAVLTFIYKLTHTEEGCKYIIETRGATDKPDMIFLDKGKEAAEMIAQYAGISTAVAKAEMEKIADEAINSIRESIGTNITKERLKVFMNHQRHNILVHLPAALQLGNLLGDEGLDDNTNKMEGPVSGFLHRIENILSDSDESKYP